MATTVRELIELLRDYPSNAQVGLAKDASGNSFAPFEEITEEEIQLEPAKERFDYDSDDEDREEESDVSVVILWPSS